MNAHSAIQPPRPPLTADELENPQASGEPVAFVPPPVKPSASITNRLEGIESCISTVYRASPGLEEKVFKLMAREAVKYAHADGISVVGVIDRFQQVAAAIGLVRERGPDAIQKFLVEAADSVTDDLATKSAQTEAWTPGLEIVCLADVKAKSVEWLWPNRIALGKVTVLAGDGGMGKSTILCDLAARVTTGALWPDGATNGRPGSVFVLAAEDALDDTVKPRLGAAGADMSKVLGVESIREERRGSRRLFNFQADLQKLERAVEERGDIRLIIVDPITSYLGKLDSHKNDQVRAVLDPLGQLAARLGVAIICNNHFSKGSGGANTRIIGSVAFVNQARAAFIVAPDPDDDIRRVFVPSKMNLGPLGNGLSYEVEGVEVELNGVILATSRILWDPTPVTMSADAVLARLSCNREQDSARVKAEGFLADLLKAGPLSVKEIDLAANGAGISERTLKRAKAKLRVVSDRTGGIGAEGWWAWRLPP